MTYLTTQYDPKRVPFNRYPDDLIEHLAARIGARAGWRVLELGTGRGDFLRSWRRAGFLATGVDRETPGAVRLDLSRDRLPWPDASFDVVFSKSVIEHLDSGEHMLREAHRVLRPGGVALIMTPDARAQGMAFWDDYTHVRPYTPTALGDVLAVAGFVSPRVELFPQYAPLWRHPALRPLAALLRHTLPLAAARWLTNVTGIGLFRWAREPALLGWARK